jgi:lysophospholipid acyltransferase (LPLAT)-like uncharacterized protein
VKIPLLRRAFGSPVVQKAVGVMAAEYLRLVWKTSRVRIEPPTIYDNIDRDLPIIIAMWHGQHFLMPFFRRPHHRGKVLISRHRDGEINAIAAERLGVETIRGSGTHGTDFHRKGGVTAFSQMRATLKGGLSVALTADVPKVARVCGLGIVKLASVSGRPIYPMAVATHHRVTLKNWDRTTINLPFGRAGGVVGSPIYVRPDANDAMLESARGAVEAALNAATARAYEIADRPGPEDGRG